jgi:uncharacterized membrane protein
MSLHSKSLIYVLLLPLFLVGVVGLVLFFIPTSSSPIFSATGIVFLVFLPGYCLSYFFWPKQEIDALERIVIAIALSLAIVPVTMFILNKARGVEINGLNTVIQVLGISVIATGLAVLRHFWSKRKSKKSSSA